MASGMRMRAFLWAKKMAMEEVVPKDYGRRDILHLCGQNGNFLGLAWGITDTV